MRKNLRWGYLLFLAALLTVLIAVSLFYLHDLKLIIMWGSFALTSPLYRKFNKFGGLKWLIPTGLGLAAVLGGLYYAGNLLIFPHSARAAYRLHDAVAAGLLWSFGGFFIAWGVNYKPT